MNDIALSAREKGARLREIQRFARLIASADAPRNPSSSKKYHRRHAFCLIPGKFNPTLEYRLIRIGRCVDYTI
ncbi:hypothetical protein [Burkholderia vietnamiensis]|uniref:hypothetical protein n=1 Tax=Burkholderia vietnamiensis TaxID=60552 RepID=UPI0012DA5A8F|nr:hypothetical protein [Burkholderia vietnamiensis]